MRCRPRWSSALSLTHQQRDLSLPDDVDDVLVLLGLLVHLPHSCSEPSGCSSGGGGAAASSVHSRSPGLGALLPTHVAPAQGEHQASLRVQARPLNQGVRVDPSGQQLVWKTLGGGHVTGRGKRRRSETRGVLLPASEKEESEEELLRRPEERSSGW